MQVVSQAGVLDKQMHWLCRCTCGSERLFTSAYIRSAVKRGVVSSCGCRKREASATKSTTHGMSKHFIFPVWTGMIRRCYDTQQKAYANYGARGITVCARWHNPALFWEDMRETYQKGLTLERIDNNAGYSKENCTWASRLAQNNNTRHVRIIQTEYGQHSVAETARLSGINEKTLWSRIRKGVPMDELLKKVKQR